MTAPTPFKTKFPLEPESATGAEGTPNDGGAAVGTPQKPKREPPKVWKLVLSAPRAWKVLAVAILLISLPTFVHAGFDPRIHPKLHWWVDKLIELCGKAGEALIVAVLLIITTIDEETRLNLIEVVVKAASPKLIARHLPDSVQAAVFRYFDIEFVRSHLEIEFVLEPVENQDYLKVISRVRGPVRHHGSSPEMFEFAGIIDPPVLPHAIAEPRISCAQVLAPDGTVLFSLPTEKAADQKSDGYFVFQVERLIHPGTVCLTSLETIEYRPKSYILPLFIGTTVETATVDVILPKKDFGVRLQLPTISGVDPKPTPTYLGFEWQLHEPLLPGQCILLTWWPHAVGTTEIPKEGAVNA